MAGGDAGVKTLLRPKPCYPSLPLPTSLPTTLPPSIPTPSPASRQTQHDIDKTGSSSDDDVLVIGEECALRPCPTDLQCGECSEYFTAYPLLSAHLTYCHGNHDVFECGLCLKFFICLMDLEDHLLDGHLSLDRGVSDMRLCNINEDEITHFMSHAEHREQVRLQCPYCGCEFGKLALYQHHMSSAHHGRAWNKEGLCEAVLKVTPSGPVHQSSKPTIELVEEQLRSKVFICSYCNKQFFGKEPMRRHAALHRTDHTFQCSQCSCYFSSESRLEQHMTHHHILLDQKNIKQNLHGDMIGTSLEDVLKANDSLARPNDSLTRPIKNTMRKSSSWSKCNKTETRGVRRTRGVERAVGVESPRSKKLPEFQKKIPQALPPPISTQAKGPVVPDPDPANPCSVPAKCDTAGGDIAGGDIAGGEWKGHRRTGSEDSLPDEDHPLHKLLVLCRYAKREQARLQSEVTVIAPSGDSEEDVEIMEVHEAEGPNLPYQETVATHSAQSTTIPNPSPATVSCPSPVHEPTHAVSHGVSHGHGVSHAVSHGVSHGEAGARFMLDTFSTCTSSEELAAYARGFLSVHLLLIHIAALSLSATNFCQS